MKKRQFILLVRKGEIGAAQQEISVKQVLFAKVVYNNLYCIHPALIQRKVLM
jgi:hypothetical protein